MKHVYRTVTAVAAGAALLLIPAVAPSAVASASPLTPERATHDSRTFLVDEGYRADAQRQPTDSKDKAGVADKAVRQQEAKAAADVQWPQAQAATPQAQSQTTAAKQIYVSAVKTDSNGANEYVVLYNPSDQAVTLDDSWRLAVGGDNAEEVFTFSGQAIAAHGFLAIKNKDYQGNNEFVANSPYVFTGADGQPLAGDQMPTTGSATIRSIAANWHDIVRWSVKDSDETEIVGDKGAAWLRCGASEGVKDLVPGGGAFTAGDESQVGSSLPVCEDEQQAGQQVEAADPKALAQPNQKTNSDGHSTKTQTPDAAVLPNKVAPAPGEKKQHAAKTTAPCKEGQERNPQTGRCKKVAAEKPEKLTLPCQSGYQRNPDTGRCKKANDPFTQKQSKLPNLTATNRRTTATGGKGGAQKTAASRRDARSGVTSKQFAAKATSSAGRKVAANKTATPCKEGYQRNPQTNRCNKIAAATTKKEPAPCKEGQERNPETGRCKKKVGDLAKAASTGKAEQTETKPETISSWWFLGSGGVAILGVIAWQWRDVLFGWFGKKVA